MRQSLKAAVRTAAIGMLSAALSGAVTARAQEVEGAPIHYHQYYKVGLASDDDVQQALGTLSFSITDCQNVWPGAVHRGVRVSSSGSNYSDQRVVETVLYRAAQYAWNTCPLFAYSGVATSDLPVYNVSSVDLYLGDGSHAISATDMSGDFAIGAGPSYAWTSVVDAGAADRAQADAAARQAQADQQAAVVQEQQQATAAVQQQASDLWWSNAWGNIKTLFWLVVFGSIGVWLFNRREPIARWYYFSFYPHPAEDTVRSAISSGRLLDGKQLATVLGEVPPVNSVFRQVRLEQATALINEMQSATQLHLRELQARAKEQYEQAAVQQSQAALAQAAIALEQAKAMLNASKRSGSR